MIGEQNERDHTELIKFLIVKCDSHKTYHVNDWHLLSNLNAMVSPNGMFTLTLRNLCIRAFRARCHPSYEKGERVPHYRDRYTDVDDFLIDHSLVMGRDTYCVDMLIELGASSALIDHFAVRYVDDDNDDEYDPRGYWLELAVKHGRKELVDHFLKLGVAADIDGLMADTIRYGHGGLVEFFLTIRPMVEDWNTWGYDTVQNWWLLHAAKLGQVELADRFVKLGATEFDGAMIRATDGGCREMIEFLITKVATDFDVDWAMSNTARHGYVDLVELFIAKGATAFNWAMRSAVEHGRRELVEFFITKGAKDLNGAMRSAAEHGHRELVELFIDMGATDFDLAMLVAAERGHVELIKLFIARGATNFNRAMMGAVVCGRQELIEFLIAMGATNFNEAMMYATWSHNRALVELFVSRGATNLEEAMHAAHVRGYEELSEFLDRAITDG